MPVNDSEFIGNWFSQAEGTANNQPPGNETRRLGDDNMRSIQAVVKNTFPNFTGAAITATEAEISRVSGVSLTDPIITFPVGTKMLFYQNVAPTGWTIDAVLDEHSVRITRGTGPGVDPGAQEGGLNGGTHDFSSVFADLPENNVPGVGGHTLLGQESGTEPHSHPLQDATLLTEYTGGTGQNPTRVKLEQQLNTGLTPVYTAGPPWVNNPDNTDLTTFSSASEAHYHSLDIAVKWAAFIVAAKT